METTNDRENKIIKQSSLKAAVEFLKDKTSDPDEVLRLAKLFENWIHEK